MKSNILVLTPSHKSIGGIANYYKVLKPKLPENVHYFTRGDRSKKQDSGKIISAIIYLYDYVRFVLKLLFGRYSLIVLNTSLGMTGLIRDGLYIKIAHLFHLKTIVFFRGIDDSVLNKIDQKYLPQFKKVFLRVNSIIVLSDMLKERLFAWNYNGKIYSETTIVDDLLVNGYKPQSDKFLTDKKINLLYLSRIEKGKGIYEFIEALKLLNLKSIHINIAGEGGSLNSIKEIVSKDKKLTKKITFLGYIEDEEKANAYKKSHIFILPSYAEGMPNSVLEAMAFGLPVITTKVGGLVDLFQEEKMGLSTSGSSDDISKKIELLLKDRKMLWKISLFNTNYAYRFNAIRVSVRLMKIFNETIG